MAAPTTDAALKRRLEDALDGNPRLDTRHVSVEVRRGAARLLGRVPNLYQKREAMDTARRAAQAASVVDELVIEPEGPFPDHQVRRLVQETLVRDHRVNEKDVSVEVRDGVVTLTGMVESPARRHFVEEDVWSIPGVVDVDDRMAVGPVPSRPDHEIARDVVESLKANPWIDASRVVVGVKEQTVRLTGSVPSREQKRLAEDAAWWVPGVRHVTNDLTLARRASTG